MGSTFLLYLAVVFATLPGGMPAAQSQSSANTRSPHGSLSIPCQNCHTLSGWKPIRAVPEFDHNTTKYPLRGMHEGVSCTQCHTKPVFTNVGTQCSQCHADIHKAPDGRKLRAVPHGAWLERFRPADQSAHEPVPADGRTRDCGLRLVPQGRRSGTVPGPFDRLLLVPPERFHQHQVNRALITSR